MITLEFDHLPSTTETSGNSRKPPIALWRAKETLKTNTWLVLQRQGLIALHDSKGNFWNRHQMQRATVTYHAYWCRTPADPDNVVAAYKPILDKLVDELLLPDDGHEHVTVAPVQYTKVAKMKDRKLVVTLEEKS